MLTHLGFNYRLFLYLSDATLTVLGLAFASKLRLSLEWGLAGPDEAFYTPVALFPITAAIWLFSFQMADVYDLLVGQNFFREVQRILVGQGIACLLFFGTLYITYRNYSRLQSLYFISLLTFFFLFHRFMIHVLFRLSGRTPGYKHFVLVIGTGENAARVGETISLYQWAGLHLVGYVQTSPEILPAVSQQVIGSLEALPALLERHSIDEILVAVNSPDDIDLLCLMRQVGTYPLSVRIVPDYTKVAYFHVTVESLAGIPLLNLREPVFSPSQLLLKRAFDLVMSGLLLLITWPLFILVYIAIQLDSHGPAVIRQQRVGQYGRPFTMIKFRSMYVDRVFPDLDPNAIHKTPDDPRITRVGKLIRRTSLDELPQLVNVFKGDMSLVGPRPEMPYMVEMYEDWQRKRFEVPQGMTGWWQINGRADKPMYLNTEDDLFYIRNYSFWLDLQILFRTLVVVIAGRGAY